MLADKDSELKTAWKKKSWTIPDLPGGKQIYFCLAVRLVKILEESQGLAPDVYPDTSGVVEPARPIKEYAPFLRKVGLARNQSGLLCLTDAGRLFCSSPTKRALAHIFQAKFRLFGEVLKLVEMTSGTVQEVNSELCSMFHLDWKNCSSTRKRMDWLEALGLISGLADFKWQITAEGIEALGAWELVTPEIIRSFDSTADIMRIEEPPTEIKNVLKRLADDPSLQRERSKYNIWVPSPNRIDNLREIVTFASEKTSRTELIHFIADRFSLRQSSVDSMFPFLKASNLIAEVGRGVYIATPAAKAWCSTGNDLDFIRLLHGNMRFVGEMIYFAKEDVSRNEVYEEAEKYCLNVEKARWIAGFLIEAGLLEETRYLHLRATPLGGQLLPELPLATPSDYASDKDNSVAVEVKSNVEPYHVDEIELMFERLYKSARDPFAGEEGSGAAFEKSIAEVLSYAGFEVSRIGGSGDTDILVRWKDSDGAVVAATVDAKSKSNGVVTHGDVSDIALESHKDKHNASFTAIIGPGFGGDTIRNHAKKKGFALITDEELAQIAKTSHMLGVDPSETALIFQVPDGLSRYEELVAQKQRQADLIALVVATFVKEQDTYGSLSARDLSLLSRSTELAPSIEELIPILNLLAAPEIHVLSINEQNAAIEHVAYTISNETTAALRLAALANAIEAGAGHAR
ncbi:MAG TPA: hypothetical protein IAA15_09630 [Candidatus Olsenella pullicola]|nr:hypothetical protein [Candidatus Olsenella pullicola]